MTKSNERRPPGRRWLLVCKSCGLILADTKATGHVVKPSRAIAEHRWTDKCPCDDTVGVFDHPTLRHQPDERSTEQLGLFDVDPGDPDPS